MSGPAEAGPGSRPDALDGASGAASGDPGNTVLCEVLRSPRRAGMYLYVDKREGLARVPEALLRAFGTPQTALVFRLQASRPLARADAAAVLQALREQGYYLQMPPGRAEESDH